MSNDFSSNFAEKLMKAFIVEMDMARVVTKTVDTQTFQGKFNAESGETIKIKRPQRGRTIRTSDGDISSSTKSDIKTGSAVATVQNYITSALEWNGKDESLKFNQMRELLRPHAEQIVIDLETDFIQWMQKYAALSVGTPGTAVDSWRDVARCRSLAKAIGVPVNEMYYIMNDFTCENLAVAQSGLGANDALVKTAWEQSVISTPFAGLKAIAHSGLANRTNGACADRAGALTAAPTATYAAAKDSMTQTLSVGSLSNAGVVKAGEILEFPGTGALARSYTNQRTRQTVIGADGNPIPWRCTVTADVTLDGSGEGDLVVSGPAIYEESGGVVGQFDNISAALDNGDVFNILGASATQYQPNLFYHPRAFAIAFCDIAKLAATDVTAITKDNILIRQHKYSDGDKNQQMIRWDVLPAYSCLDPFFAGQAFGLA